MINAMQELLAMLKDEQTTCNVPKTGGFGGKLEQRSMVRFFAGSEFQL